MAIVIPSSKTYDRQNPKVRDNVIERIEVGAVEVVPDNKYEERIFNGRVPIENKKFNSFLGESSIEMGNYATYRPTVCSGTKNYSYEYITFDLVVKRQMKNSYATSIFSGQKENGDNYIGIAKVVSREVFEYNIENGVTFEGNYINEYDYTYSFDTEKILSYNGNKETIERKQYNDIDGEKITFSINDQNQYPVAGSVVDKLNYIKKDILSKGENIQTKSTVEGGMAIWSIPSFEAVENIKNDEYISLLSPTIETYEDRFVIKNISVPVSLRTIYYASAFYRPLGDGHTINDRFSNKYPVKVVEVVQVAQQIEITVYGNTIGIDLTDKTVYIPETDKTSKKVFSVEGNELMQTSNYVVTTGSDIEKLLVGGGKDYSSVLESANQDGEPPYTRAFIYLTSQELIGTPIIVKFYETDQFGDIRDTWQIEYTTNDGAIDTGTQYYFSYIEVFSKITTQFIPAIEKMYAETQAQYANGKETATIRCSISNYFENDGTKAISVDNSTGKMSFKLYDQVIPMVYGADGQDHPMSTYKDGSAKVFQVLGSKIFYDGAVWQELSLQELDKTKIL